MVIFIFILGITLGSLGGILMKIGAGHIGAVEISSLSNVGSFIFKALTDTSLVFGLALYFISAIIWSYLLTKFDISYVQPILALTYVLTPILAIFILQEHVSYMRWAGIVIIVIGVFVVARSASV